MKLTLKVWRQKNRNDKGKIVTYKVKNISKDSSFLEMLDILNNDLLEKIRAMGAQVDELAWPMPLLPAFEKEMTSSKFADVRNGGKGRYGGANTAAAFLKQFIQEREDDNGHKLSLIHI